MKYSVFEKVVKQLHKHKAGEECLVFDKKRTILGDKWLTAYVGTVRIAEWTKAGGFLWYGVKVSHKDLINWLYM